MGIGCLREDCRRAVRQRDRVGLRNRRIPSGPGGVHRRCIVLGKARVRHRHRERRIRRKARHGPAQWDATAGVRFRVVDDIVAKNRGDGHHRQGLGHRDDLVCRCLVAVGVGCPREDCRRAVRQRDRVGLRNRRIPSGPGSVNRRYIVLGKARVRHRHRERRVRRKARHGPAQWDATAGGRFRIVDDIVAKNRGDGHHRQDDIDSTGNGQRFSGQSGIGAAIIVDRQECDHFAERTGMRNAQRYSRRGVALASGNARKRIEACICKLNVAGNHETPGKIVCRGRRAVENAQGNGRRCRDRSHIEFIVRAILRECPTAGVLQPGGLGCRNGGRT